MLKTEERLSKDVEAALMEVTCAFVRARDEVIEKWLALPDNTWADVVPVAERWIANGRAELRRVVDEVEYRRQHRMPDSGVANQNRSTAAVPSGLVVYSDGACDPNPGRGGWAFVAYRNGQEIHSECGGAPETTNQRMELTGALKALEWLEAYGSGDDNTGISVVHLFSDSKYTVDGCNDWRHAWKRKGWLRGKSKEVANVDLWKALDAALTAIPIKLQWCKAHIGIIGNERADELSLVGRDKSAAFLGGYGRADR